MPKRIATCRMLPTSPQPTRSRARGLSLLAAAALVLAPGSSPLAQQADPLGSRVSGFWLATIDELRPSGAFVDLVQSNAPHRWVVFSTETPFELPLDLDFSSLIQPADSPPGQPQAAASRQISDSLVERLDGLPPLSELFGDTAAAPTLPEHYAKHTVEYTYDPLGRLTDIEASDGALSALGYDAAGNRTFTSFEP